MHARPRRTRCARSAGRAPSAIVALVVLPAAAAPRAQDSPILAAMRDELARSMSELRLKDQPPPYYIEYEVEDRAVDARHGAARRARRRPDGRSRDAARRACASATTTSTARCSTRRDGGGGRRPAARPTAAPARRSTTTTTRCAGRSGWRPTPRTSARSASSRGRRRRSRIAPTADALPDFSREKPAETVLPRAAAGVRQSRLARTRAGSSRRSSRRRSDDRQLRRVGRRHARHALLPEQRGLKVVAPIQIASIRVYGRGARRRRHDGARRRSRSSRSDLQDLPPVSELIARTREMADARRGRARGADRRGVHRAGAARRAGQRGDRRAVARAGDAGAAAAREPTGAWRRRRRRGAAGHAVSPAHRPARADRAVLGERHAVARRSSAAGRCPERTSWTTTASAPKDVTLVEKGRLVTLLTGRDAAAGLLQSNGHTRGGDVQAGRVPDAEQRSGVRAGDLKRKYLELLKTQDKPFGYIVRGVANPADVPAAAARGGPLILDAVKVDAGRRGSRWFAACASAPIAPAVFRDLLDALDASGRSTAIASARPTRCRSSCRT